MTHFKKVLKLAGIILIVAFVVLLIGRGVYRFNDSRTEKQVAKIHATKLTLDDVLGTKLPPELGAEAAAATVEGVDANENGIRDDVELAIFKEYPNSAKTRAVLLQYALALQMEMTQPIVNTKTVTAVVQEVDRAHLCIGEILSRSDVTKLLEAVDKLGVFVENEQFNTSTREKLKQRFLKNIGSYSSLDRICDINYSDLSD